MKKFFAAIRFLTVLPIPSAWGGGENQAENLAGSPIYFPVVGILLGGLIALITWAVIQVMPALPAAVIAVLLLAAISGALHLDGLADSADGFFSSRKPERILEIMRDSQIGTMGALVLFGALFLKVAGLSVLSDIQMVGAVFLMPVAGRSALSISMALLPYARGENGLGTVFYQRQHWQTVPAAILILTGAGGLTFAEAGLAVAAAVLLAILLVARYIRKQIGGATGDTLGATCEVAETIAPLVLCAAL